MRAQGKTTLIPPVINPVLLNEQQRPRDDAAAIAAYAQHVINKKRRERGLPPLPDKTDQRLQPTVNILDAAAAWLEKSKSKVQPKQTPFPIQPSGGRVKLYPDIGLEALNQGKAPYLRLWLILRYLDPRGSGSVSRLALKAALRMKKPRFAGLGSENVRKLLRTGSDFWTIDPSDRIRYASAENLAKLLNVGRLTGFPVLMRVSRLKDIGTFKAAIYDAFHSGQKNPGLMSRRTQEQLTGIPATTQRHYTRKAKITVRANVAIGDRLNKESQQTAAWNHAGSFTFRDHENGGMFAAWKLPNAYIGTLEQTARGSQRKINRTLLNFANKGTQSKQQIERLFFDSGSAAGKAYNRQPGLDRYWSHTEPAKPEKPRFWYVLPGVD